MTLIQSEKLSRVHNQPDVARQLKRLGNALLRFMFLATIGAVILVFAGSTIPALLGMKTTVVTSGSMEPAIGVGDAAYIRSVAAEVPQVGDVITYGSLGGLGMTTHRVMAILEIDGTTYFQTKGDFNRTPDPNLTPADAVHGRSTWSCPSLASFSPSQPGRWARCCCSAYP